MLQRTLPALLAAALWTTVLTPMYAQAKSKKTGAKGTTKAAPAKTGVEAEIVGSVNNKKYTFGEVLAKVQKDNPQGFMDAIGQALGKKATEAFFKPNPSREMTLTRAGVLAELRQSPPKLLGDTLNQLLQLEAINQEAAKEAAKVGVTPTDAQLDAFTSSVIKKTMARAQARPGGGGIPPTMTEEQFLKLNKVTRSQLKTTILRPQLLLNNLAQNGLEKRIKHAITPDDFLKARHILVGIKPAAPDAKPEDTKKADADALAKITQIAEDIKANKKTFEQAAKDNSEDEESKKNGGELGIFTRGLMVAEFESTAFGLKPGEISKPVRSQFGYHLIQVEKTGKELTPEERQDFLEKYGANQIPTLVRELVNRAKVVNKLAQEPTIPFPIGPGGGPR